MTTFPPSQVTVRVKVEKPSMEETPCAGASWETPAPPLPRPQEGATLSRPGPELPCIPNEEPQPPPGMKGMGVLGVTPPGQSTTGRGGVPQGLGGQRGTVSMQRAVGDMGGHWSIGRAG